MFKVYKPEYNPANLTGIVGGGISSYPVSGYLNELFYHIDAPASGIDTSTVQYRKVFVKNTYSSTSTYTRVWIEAIEHEDQIYIANCTGLVDSTLSPSTPPSGVSGWTAPSNYTEGLNLGTLNPNGYTGFWLQQYLSGISDPDPYATFRLRIGGIIT